MANTYMYVGVHPTLTGRARLDGYQRGPGLAGPNGPIASAATATDQRTIDLPGTPRSRTDFTVPALPLVIAGAGVFAGSGRGAPGMIGGALLGYMAGLFLMNALSPAMTAA